MFKRIVRIKKILELAELEMEQAAKTMAYMTDKLAQEQQQMHSLLEYQKDYVKKPAQSGKINPIQLQTHNAFSDKLVQALAQQKNQLKESEKMLEMAQNAWQEKRIRVKALDALIERMKKQENTRINKQEQRFLDELSSQKYAAKSRS